MHCRVINDRQIFATAGLIQIGHHRGLSFSVFDVVRRRANAVRFCHIEVRTLWQPHAYSLAYASCSLGFLYLVKGDLELAIISLERSEKICESSEIRVLTAQVGSNLGYAYALAGRINDGIPLLEKANEQSEAIGRKGGWALRLTWLAHGSLLEGRIGAAREHCQRALALAGAGGERG